MVSFIMLFTVILFPCCSESGMIDPVIDSLEVDNCASLFPPEDTVIVSHTNFTKTNYPARIKVFKADTIDEGDIVMLGNSLTQEGGNWNIKLDVTNAKNRGISGDNTDGALARLNELICRKPSVVFMMVGTNDLFLSYSPEKVAHNIDTIGTILSTELPQARIIVQTIMPLGAGHNKKSKVLEINNLLKAIDGSTYELLDTYEHMANEAGDLPEEYTYDGVHLTAEGYSLWSGFLSAELKE